MTLDQFDNLAISEIGAAWPELRAMVADNARLKALVKKTEDLIDGCPWCRSEFSNTALLSHADDCPAFTRDGEVK